MRASRLPVITAITVGGFKSIRDPQRIEIGPLTVLAGANSSGKSSMIQPLLLLKQTLDAPYDPGPLLLGGPNVQFTAVEQVLSSSKSEFFISFENNDKTTTYAFKGAPERGFEVKELRVNLPGKGEVILRPNMSREKILNILETLYSDVPPLLEEIKNSDLKVRRDRFSLLILSKPIGFNLSNIGESLLYLIHVPALRGNPERNYKVTPVVRSPFPGTFENYTASVIYSWQEKGDDKINELAGDLKELGLTWKVKAKKLGLEQVELQVGRLTKGTRGGARDLVSIADVGFGVSQVLPVLVALLVAEPRQMVYIEQPEIHLHPRAQVALAGILAKAARRGVRVIIETHSDLLLLGIQTVVANKRLSGEKVKLHWFTRNKEGFTEVRSTELDESGAFKDREWPEDFSDVSMRAQSDYLDAAGNSD